MRNAVTASLLALGFGLGLLIYDGFLRTVAAALSISLSSLLSSLPLRATQAGAFGIVALLCILGRKIHAVWPRSVGVGLASGLITGLVSSLAWYLVWTVHNLTGSDVIFSTGKFITQYGLPALMGLVVGMWTRSRVAA